MWNKIVAWWNALPHYVQAVIVAFVGAVVGALEPVIGQWAYGQQVCTVALGACLKAYLVSAAKAGILAVLGLYIKSSFHKPA